ncbi:MAG: prephenate dehydrogenase [Longimicrobiales bacterium]
MTVPLPRRLAIVGFGLMGASLARSLKRRTGAPAIVAATREQGIGAGALTDAAVDVTLASEDAAIEAADLVVYATPVGVTLTLLERHADRLRRAGAVATDVGSVKAPVVALARRLGLDRFVGGHPLCGAETSGFAASRADLYDGARVFLVPAADAAATGLVDALWRAAGAVRIEPIDPVSHDQRMAWVSHLPQLLSSALAACLADAGQSHDDLGPGGNDVLRLASSEAALWSDILRRNAAQVEPALGALLATLQAMHRALRDGDDAALESVLARGRVWARGARP